MGRLLTFLVTAILFGSGYLLFNGQRSTFKVHEHQSDYQFKGIAGNVARSGFERGVGVIKRDLMDTPGAFEQVSMGDGYYNLEITPDIYGDLGVAVNAQSGEAEYTMTGNVLFTASLPAAVMLEDDGVLVSGSGFYQISGVDQRMPSRGVGGGHREPVRGIMTTESHVNEITSSLTMNRVVGIGAESEPGDPIYAGSVAGEFSEAEIEALYQQARIEAHATLSPGPNGNVAEGSLVAALAGSSPGNPKIIRALGNVNLLGSLHGYGMLIVEDGDLNIFSPNFDWEGVIMVRKQNKDTVHVNLNNATVHGALVAYDVDGGGEETECVPDFEIIGDEAVVNVPFKVKVEVLGAAITAGGDYDMPVTTRIHVGGTAYEPWGDYDKALDGNVNTGNSGVTYLWEPETVFPAGSIVSIDGRSWTRKEDTDGDTNEDWKIHMEEHSSTAGPQIYLLEDGSPVPDIGGFMGQYSVVEFLEDYIENDHLVVEPSQAVSLFELGVTDTGSEAFDSQDLVVLVTLIDASEEVCFVEGAPSLLDVAFRDGTQIHYSTEAIAKLGRHLSTISNNISVQVARSAIHGSGRNETIIFQNGLAEDDGEGADADAPAGTGTVSVCHNNQTMTIAASSLGAHIAHGDYMGACSGGP